MERKPCYIDRDLCTGAHFSFCNACKRSQKENQDEIQCAKIPLENTFAHIPSKDKK